MSDVAIIVVQSSIKFHILHAVYCKSKLKLVTRMSGSRGIYFSSKAIFTIWASEHEFAKTHIQLCSILITRAHSPKGVGTSQVIQAVWYLLFLFFEAQIRIFEIAQCAL